MNIYQCRMPEDPPGYACGTCERWIEEGDDHDRRCPDYGIGPTYTPTSEEDEEP